MPVRKPIAVLLAAIALGGCGGMSAQTPAASGEPKTTSTRALEAGAAALQAKRPLDALNTYLNGFHFHADDMGRQMEEHHYCGNLSEDLIQCVLYDRSSGDAKLVGVEYVISARLFRSLPEAEKRLWHSHRHEVSSGQLVAPGVPSPIEHVLMEKLVSTYGKIWHTWHADRDPLPVGVPELMMGFTSDGQLRPELLGERDRRLGIASEEKRRSRSDISAPDPDPAADSWKSGRSPRLRVEPVPVRGTP